VSTTFRRTRTFYVPLSVTGGVGAAVGSGLMTLGGAGTANVRSSGSSSLALSASGTARNPSALSSSASLGLSAVGSSRSTTSGTASLALSAVYATTSSTSTSYPGALPGRARPGISRPDSSPTFTAAASTTAALSLGAVGATSGRLTTTASLALTASGAAAAADFDGAVLADSPVLYYKFTETSGTSVTDFSSNGRTGTYVGSPTLTGDGFISASGQYVTMPFTGLPTGDSPYTIEWIVTPTDVTGQHDVCGWGSSSGVNNAVTSSGTNGTAVWNYWNGSNVTTPSQPGVASGTEVRVMCVYNQANITIYVNGTQQIQITRTSHACATSGAAVIGRAPIGTVPFLGKIRRVAVYNTALSGARASAHANAPLPATSSGASGSGSLTLGAAGTTATRVTANASLTLGASGSAAQSGGGGGGAAITNRNLTGSTANTTTYATTSFTPVANELLAVIVHATASVATDTTLTASANSMTFTQVGTLVHALSGHISVVFVSNQLVPSSPTAMTVTFTCTSDAATGAFIEVDGVSGMTKTGLTAIKKTAFSPNIAANQAWTVTFASATGTSNPLLGFVAHVGGAVVTPPAGWTEVNQPADQVTPGQGFETAKADSGQTGTTYTWTSSLGSPTFNTRANVGAVEFDTT
jgi:hypothetical protein